MKATEIINDFLSNIKPTEKNTEGLKSFSNDMMIYGNELRPFKNKLMECDEFKDCELLEFLTAPVVQNKEGKVITAMDIVLGDGMKFKGRCFLLSLSLTPIMYDRETMYNPVKDGVVLTPILHDEKSFESYRKLILPISLEEMSDDFLLAKAELNVLINKVFKNPEEYTPKGIRKVIARGIFERITTEEGVERDSKLNLDIDLSEPPQYSQVFYIHYEHIDGTDKVTMSIKSKLMHNSLKDKFLKHFEGKELVMEEDLNKFLEENQ